MLKFTDSFPDFENYLYNVRCQLINKWVEIVKTAPSKTPYIDIPGQEEAREDIRKFDYFCKKYLGYEQYPKGHPHEYEFHYMGDTDSDNDNEPDEIRS